LSHAGHRDRDVVNSGACPIPVGIPRQKLILDEEASVNVQGLRI
jgi:hypothetical protein